MAASLKLALVGWATDSGVGREFTDAIKHLPTAGIFVIPHAIHATRHDLLPAGAIAPASLKNPREEMKRFLEKAKPDVILTWEVPGSEDFPEIWRTAGIRWVNVVHWDWFTPEAMTAWKHADLIAPNTMCQRGLMERYSLPSTLLPVPVDTDTFRYKERTKAERFVTVYGQGGPYDRRALAEILAAWSKMSPPPPLVVRAQRKPGGVGEFPRGVSLDLSSKQDPATLYADADVAVQPSKFEGVGLSLLEAQACGLPVITVDAEPMNQVAPDFLAPAESASSEEIMKGHRVECNVVSIEALKKTVVSVAGSPITNYSRRARGRVEKRFSWKALKADWIRMLLDRRENFVV